MKKQIVIFLVCFMFLTAAVAYAKNENAGSNSNANVDKQEKIDEKKADIQDKKDEMQAKKDEMQEKRDEKKAEIKSKLEEMREQKCERVQERVQSREKLYGENKTKYENVFSGIQKRIENLIVLFKDAGLDTAQLEQDFETYKTKITEVAASHEELMNQVRTTKNYTCDKPYEDFKTQLQETKRLRTQTRTKFLEVIRFYQLTLREDVFDLREQYQALTGEGEEEETEDVDSGEGSEE